MILTSVNSRSDATIFCSAGTAATSSANSVSLVCGPVWRSMVCSDCTANAVRTPRAAGSMKSRTGPRNDPRYRIAITSSTEP